MTIFILFNSFIPFSRLLASFPLLISHLQIAITSVFFPAFISIALCLMQFCSKYNCAENSHIFCNTFISSVVECWHVKIARVCPQIKHNRNKKRNDESHRWQKQTYDFF